MEVDEEHLSVSPMVVEVDNGAEETSSNIQAEDLMSEPLPPIERAEPWHAQFSSEWLPIITRDIARQQRQVMLVLNFLSKKHFLSYLSVVALLIDCSTSLFRRLHIWNVLKTTKDSSKQEACYECSAICC